MPAAGFLQGGRPAAAEAVAAAAERGVDRSRHLSRRINAEVVRRAGLIVGMDARQRWAVRTLFRKPSETIVLLADLLPEFGDARVIPDPVDQPVETFQRVYGQIDECLATLRAALAPPRG